MRTDENITEKNLWRFFFFILMFIVSFSITIFAMEINLALGWRIGLTVLGLYSFYLSLLEISSKSQGIKIPNAWKIVVVALICLCLINIVRVVMFYMNISEITQLFEYLISFVKDVNMN